MWMKTRLRRLTIDGLTYRWAVGIRHNGGSITEQSLIQVRVWGDQRGSAPLIVDVVIAQWGFIYVLPSEVRTIIEAGLASGWQPGQRGSPFTLPEAFYAGAVAAIHARYAPTSHPILQEPNAI
jgi:hypothetical protein